MAVPNMIVTLVANTTKWASGLRNAASSAGSWGARVGAIFKSVGVGILGVIVSIGHLMAKFAEMGRESRKANVQLDYMIKRMFGVGRNAASAAVRLKEYATKVMLATGIDDEQVKAVQQKILIFKSLGDTIGQMGGTFDRATMAAIDLASAGFGDMEANATKLGRMLENPVKNLNALNRAGVTFTEVEKAKIAKLTESGKLYKAQDIILGSIEGRVGGIAERSATGWDKLNAQFKDMGDTIGEAINPALEQVNKELSAWLASPQGKKDLEAIVQGFVAIAKALADAVALLKTWNELNNANKGFGDITKGGPANSKSGTGPLWSQGTGGGATVGGPTPTMGSVVVNFNAPVDSVSAGREVERVLNDYRRASGKR